MRFFLKACLALLCLSMTILTLDASSAPVTQSMTSPSLYNKEGKQDIPPITLRASAVTWNLAEKTPYPEDVSLLRSLSVDNDIVVIGCQECEEISPLRRQEGDKSKAWKSFQRRGLSKTHKCLQEHTLGGVHLAIYVSKTTLQRVKDKKLPKLKVCDVFDVACGIGNLLANKGGICVTLAIGDRKIGFLSAHLAAHQGKVKKRNDDYMRIMTSLDEHLSPNDESSNTRYTSAGSGSRAITTTSSGSAGSKGDQKRKKSNKKKKKRKESGGHGDYDRKEREGDSTSDSTPKRREKKEVTDMDFTCLGTRARERVGIKDIAPPSLSSLDDDNSVDNTLNSDDGTMAHVDRELTPLQIRTSDNTIVTRVPIHPKLALNYDDTYDSSLKYLVREFDAMVFVGDLNYRLDLPRLEVERLKEEMTLKYPNFNQDADPGLIKLRERCRKKGKVYDDGGEPTAEELNVFHKELEGVMEYDQLFRQRSIGELSSLLLLL